MFTKLHRPQMSANSRDEFNEINKYMICNVMLQ